MQLKSEEPKASSSKVEAEKDVLRIECDELGAAGQRTNEAREHLDKEMQLKSEEPKASSSKMEAEEEVLRKKCAELGAAGQNINEGSDGCVQKSYKSNQKIGTTKESFREMLKDEPTMDEDASASEKNCNNIKAATQDNLKIFHKRKGTGGISGQLYVIFLVLLILIHGLTNKNITHFHLASNVEEAGDFDDVVFSYSYKDLNEAEKNKVTLLQAKKTGKGYFNLRKYFKSYRNIKKNFEGESSTDPIFESDFEECEFIISEKDCNNIKAATQRTNEAREHLDKEMQLKSENPKASSSKMEVEEDVLRKKCDELGTAGQNINEGSNGCVRKSNKSNQKIGTAKMQKDEATMDEDASASEKDCNNIKAVTQDKLKIFHKREGTGGISGQLYEIYLVLLIFIHGLTNKNITNFHLASNVEEAGDFDDVVFSYTYKDLNGAEKIKVIFLQAKHKEKTKNITLEELLGKTGKGGFDLKKYFKSFRNIKKNFERGDSADPIFGRDFKECEFIIYTNALFKVGYTEKVYIKEMLAEEDWILNVKGERIKYYQLRFSENKNKRIKTFLESIGKSEEQEFHEFLSKLKICTAQPNQDQLKKIIEEEIQFHYGVTRSDIETVFPVVKNKIEAWWKNSSDYLTEKNTIIQNAARFSIRFEVQDPVPGFTGREQSLRDLHKALQSTGHSVISSALITGLGGIGKTELARKYVSQYGQDYDNNVIWINAETYSTSSESFRRLARDALGIGIKTIDGENKDINRIKSEVYAFFTKRNKKSLFIFDNAENPQDGATAKVEENVISFLPSGDNKPYVLITSRNQQWGRIQSLQLDLFTKAESAQFINKYLSKRGIKCEESEIKSLGEILQYLPLALRQAVAYIAMENERLQKWNESYTIESYLKEYEDKARQFLGKAPQDVFDTYAKTVLTTWEVTIEKIKQHEKYGMESELILNIIAFFAPNNIPIITIFDSLIGKENVRGCVEILVKYSLVQLQGGEVSIHRLLQQVIRIMLQNERKDIDVIERTLCLFYDDISLDCIMHARSVWDYAKNLNNVVENFSRVPLLIIEKLVGAIKYSDAYSIMMRTYKLFKYVLGDSHPDTVQCLHWKGDILCKQGNYNAAELVFQEVLCKSNEILGPDHPSTLTVKHNMADVLNKQGKYEESFSLYQEVLCKRKEILGPDHPKTLLTKQNIALVLDKQGKYKESFILYQEVLCKQMEILGPAHPSTLTTEHNMAFTLDKQGKNEESLILYQEVLCKRKEMLGPDHPETLVTKHNMACILYQQGKYEESLILLQEVLCKQQEILGPDHPETLLIMHNLASVSQRRRKNNTILKRILKRIFT